MAGRRSQAEDGLDNDILFLDGDGGGGGGAHESHVDDDVQLEAPGLGGGNDIAEGVLMMVAVLENAQMVAKQMLAEADIATGVFRNADRK